MPEKGYWSHIRRFSKPLAALVLTAAMAGTPSHADSHTPPARQLAETESPRMLYAAGVVPFNVIVISDTEMTEAEKAQLPEYLEQAYYFWEEAARPTTNLDIITANVHIEVTPVSPFDYPYNQSAKWLDPILLKQIPPPEYPVTDLDLMNEYNRYMLKQFNLTRAEQGLEGSRQTSTLVLVRERITGRNSYPDGKTDYAYLRGPMAVVRIPRNISPFIYRTAWNLSHEIGHLWGVPDQYVHPDTTCASRWGYLDWQLENYIGRTGDPEIDKYCTENVPDIMRGSTEPTVSRTTAMQAGFGDANKDGVTDIAGHLEYEFSQSEENGTIIISGTVTRIPAVTPYTEDPVEGISGAYFYSARLNEVFQLSDEELKLSEDGNTMQVSFSVPPEIAEAKADLQLCTSHRFGPNRICQWSIELVPADYDTYLPLVTLD